MRDKELTAILDKLVRDLKNSGADPNCLVIELPQEVFTLVATSLGAPQGAGMIVYRGVKLALQPEVVIN